MIEIQNKYQIDLTIFAETREDLQKHLRENKISTRIMYPPVDKQLAYSIPGEHSISNLVGKKGLWFPSSSQLTDE